MKVDSNSREQYPTAEVARLAGVHKDTLLRWLRSGQIPEPRRDRKGWRYFSPDEAKFIVAFAQTSVAPISALDNVNNENNPDPAFLSLRAIDWDFSGAKTNYLTHGIHPYPAKFIPQIPNALIQELSSVGDTVGDIFCGSGTTLVEALTLKRNAVGIDANPLACLIASAKIGFLTGIGAESLQALAARARDASESIAEAGTSDLFPSNIFTSKSWRPDFPKLVFWFDRHVIEELAEILGWCRRLEDSAARDLALTTFSSIVVAVSKQDSDTRYVRREKGIAPGDTMRRFARALEQTMLAAVEFSDIVEPRFTNKVIAEDLLSSPAIPQLDLVVCSPPYPNAYSYHLYHMTRMIWLGMDQPKFKREEIGSHRKYSSKGKSAANAETFRQEFTHILKWLSKCLKRKKHACFVVGDSTLKGNRIDNAALISSAGRDAGFHEAFRIERTMQVTKKAFNPAHGRIKTETILVLENSGGGE